MNKISSLPVPTAKGQVGGHEGVGEVVAQGAGVDFPEVGAKVGIKFAADACLSCSKYTPSHSVTLPTQPTDTWLGSKLP